MIKNKKTILIIIILSFLLFGLNFALALEITYPDIGPWKPGTTVEAYFAYIYHFIISIGGLLALLALIWGGITWLISTGNPAQIADAKDRISKGLLGIIIILASYLIIFQINPNLTIFVITKEPPKPLFRPEDLSGIIICKEEVACSTIGNDLDNEDYRKCLFDELGSRCFEAFGSCEIPSDYRGNFKIYSVRKAGEPYNYVILVDENKGEGKFEKGCAVWVNSGWFIGANGRFTGGQLSEGTLRPPNINAQYMIIGRFPDRRPYPLSSWTGIGVKFCEHESDCGSGGSEVWKYFPEDKKGIYWTSLNSNLLPVRRMETIKGEFQIILSDKTSLNGECYIETISTEGIYLNVPFGHFEDDPTTPEVEETWWATIGSMILFPKGEAAGAPPTGGSYAGANECFGAANPTQDKDCIDADCPNIVPQLVTIDFMGQHIRVHQKAKAAFEGVNSDLNLNPVARNYFYDADGWDNGGTFCCRFVRGSTSTPSPHSYAIAIDINPGSNLGKYASPPAPCSGDMSPEVIAIFRNHGFKWGGDYCDPMHFEWMAWQPWQANCPL